MQSLHESAAAELNEQRQLLRTSESVHEHNVTLQVGEGGGLGVLHSVAWRRCAVNCLTVGTICVSGRIVCELSAALPLLPSAQERIAGLEGQLTQQTVEVRVWQIQLNCESSVLQSTWIRLQNAVRNDIITE